MFKRNLKTKVGVMLAVATVMASSMSVFAGIDYSSFNLSLPGLNKSKYTGSQIKNTIGASGQIKDYSSGAAANVDARMLNGEDEASKWTRNLNKNNTTYTMEGTSKHKAGDKIRTEFSSDITTTVAVDISGKWRSN